MTLEDKELNSIVERLWGLESSLEEAKETLKELGEKADSHRERFDSKIEEVRERVMLRIEELRTKIEDTRERLTKRGEDLYEQFNKRVNDLCSVYNNQFLSRLEFEAAFNPIKTLVYRVVWVVLSGVLGIGLLLVFKGKVI